MDIKQKSLDFSFELGDKGTVIGYGAVFGNLDRNGDIIDKKAFDSFDFKPLPMLWQHNREQPIGLWDEFEVTDKGLKIKGHMLIDELAQAKEAYVLVKAGIVHGLSVGFRIKDYEFDKERNLHFTDIELVEVSIVTVPANPEANITAVKSELTIRDAEKALILAGFSHKTAKEILSKGFKSATVRDEQKEQRDVDNEILNSMQMLKNLFTRKD